VRAAQAMALLHGTILRIASTVRGGITMNLLACLILTVAAVAPAPEIAGTIVDYNGRPLAGISISVVGLTSDARVTKNAVSRTDGSFSFMGLAPGAYGLRAQTDWGCAISDPIRVDVGFTTIVRLRLVKALCKNAITL
jgi:hypothetical protein